MNEEYKSPSRIWIIAALLIALVGSGLSIYLSVHHNRKIADPTYVSACNKLSGFDCDTVNTSPYSEIFGIPVAMIGFVFWAGLSFLSFIRLRNDDYQGSIAISWATLLSMCGLVFSAWMAFASFVIIGEKCLFCIGLYATAILYPIAGFKASGLTAGEMISRLIEDLQTRYVSRLIYAALALGALILGVRLPYMLSPADGPKTGGLARIVEEYKSAPQALAGSGEAFYKGASSPTVTIVEFADFECPACRKEAGELRKLVKKYPKDVRVYFRHFPLNPECNGDVHRMIHQYACGAAIAAECAGQQGQFWAYHDKLFVEWGEPKPDLSRAGLETFAEQLGLNTDEFVACLDAPDLVLAKIQQDVQDAALIDVGSTPTLVVNKKKISRVVSFTEWQELMRFLGVEADEAEHVEEHAEQDRERG